MLPPHMLTRPAGCSDHSETGAGCYFQLAVLQSANIYCCAPCRLEYIGTSEMKYCLMILYTATLFGTVALLIEFSIKVTQVCTLGIPLSSSDALCCRVPTVEQRYCCDAVLLRTLVAQRCTFPCQVIACCGCRLRH